jgi:hypothetical protein
MLLTFRPIDRWPDGWDRSKPPTRYSPFKATYRSTLELLDRELYQLSAKNTVLQVDASERDCRMDGQLRADAKLRYDGVILAFETKKYGPLSYPCNAFTGGYKNPGWQSNLRAIALGLEALRKVERYGIAPRGEQYQGWAQLGSGIALGPTKMTVEGAAAFIAKYSQDPDGRLVDVEADPFFATALFNEAPFRLHPDTGGDPDLFKQLIEARDVLEAELVETAE